MYTHILTKYKNNVDNRDNEDKLSVPHELESKQSSAPKESAKQNLNQPLRKLSNKQKLVNEDWELDCEICGAKGINKVTFSILSIMSLFFNGFDIG